MLQNINYKQKYIKYKLKYCELKKLSKMTGGSDVLIEQPQSTENTPFKYKFCYDDLPSVWPERKVYKSAILDTNMIETLDNDWDFSVRWFF